MAPPPLWVHTGFCVLFSLIFSARANDLFAPPQGALTPKDQLLEEGTELVTNCTLFDNYNKSYNASDLHFEVGLQHIYSRQFVHVLSSRIVQLRYPHFNTSHTDSILCHDPEGPVWRAATTADCARRPMTPTISGCVALDWKNLTCEWEPSVVDQDLWSHTGDNQYNISWVNWSPFSSEVQRGFEIIEKVESTSFSWLPSFGASHMCMGETIDIKIEASNKLTNIHNLPKPSVSLLVDPCTKVQTKAVSDVTFLRLNSRHVDLTWTAPVVPDQAVQKDLKFLVQYSGVWGDEKLETSLEVEDATSVQLKTKPYVNYSVSVQAILRFGGHASEAVVKSWRSPSDVPERNPEISPFAFEIQQRKCQSQRLVTILWKELDVKLHNGPLLRYRVQERWPPSNVWRTLEEKTGVKGHSLCLQSDQAIQLRVVAENIFGRADTSAVDVYNIPEDPEDLQWFIAEGEILTNGSSLVHFTWVLENVTETSKIAKRDAEEDLVLFWCQGTNYNCSGELHWQSVSFDEGSHALYLPHSFHKYRYGLANRNGLQWSSCSFDYSAAPLPPNKVLVKTSTDHGELDITITVPPCLPGSGYIKAFEIVHCLTDGEGCLGEEESVLVPRGTLDYGSTLLFPLQVKPGSHHLVSVYSVARGARRSHMAHPASTAKASQSWASAGAVLGVVVTCVLVLLLFVGGFVTVIRYCQRKKKNFESGLAITRLPKHQRHSDCSTSPMLVENYLNGNTCRTNGYLRQVSSLSTLSVDSGTGSLNYDQLSPHGDQRKTSSGRIQRFTSIPESPVEEEATEAYPLTPTKSHTPPPGGQEETTFSMPSYANVGMATNDPLPVDQWDAQKPSMSGSQIADYTQVGNLAPPDGAHENAADNRSIGPSSLVNSGSDWTPCKVSDGYSSELPPVPGSNKPEWPPSGGASGYTAPEALSTDRGYAPHSALFPDKDRGYAPHSALHESIPQNSSKPVSEMANTGGYTSPNMLPQNIEYAPHSALSNNNGPEKGASVYLPVDVVFGRLMSQANGYPPHSSLPSTVNNDPPLNGYTSVGMLSQQDTQDNGYTPPASLPSSAYTSPESLQAQQGSSPKPERHDSGYTSHLSSSDSDLQKEATGYVPVDSLNAQPAQPKSSAYVAVESLAAPQPLDVPSLCNGDGYTSVQEVERRGLVASPVH